jgi:hypothetical protein
LTPDHEEMVKGLAETHTPGARLLPFGQQVATFTYCASNVACYVARALEGHERIRAQPTVVPLASDGHAQELAALPRLAIVAVGLHHQAQAAAMLERDNPVFA